MLEEFDVKYPIAKYIDRTAFFRCYQTIQSWLDMNILFGHLMKYGVIKNNEDMMLIANPGYEHQYRMTSLFTMLERTGREGYALFYMCLKETSEQSRGHKSAVEELEQYGM